MITKSGRVQKIQKKKKKKIFIQGRFRLRFPIYGDKKGVKVSGFVFFRKGRGKMRNRL